MCTVIHGHNTPIQEQYEKERRLWCRFWSYVQKTNGCWLWTGGKSMGYGHFRVSGTSIRAHRYAWQSRGGKIAPGFCILHHCDNRACVRPDHLYIGTRADNNRDARERGQHVGAARHPKEARIRALRKQGLSYRDIMKRVRVSPATLSRYFSPRKVR